MMDALLSEPIFTSKTELLTGFDSFKLYGKKCVFSTGELLHPKAKSRLQLIRSIVVF